MRREAGMRPSLRGRLNEWSRPCQRWNVGGWPRFEFAHTLGASRQGLLLASHAAASLERSHVVSNGTGRPVAPFSLPSRHATPAMSICAQSYFFVKRDRKHAAVMLPPARPAMFAKSAKLLLRPS